MRFMVLVKASKESEAGNLPSEELMMAMGKFNQELLDAGIMKAGEGLHPTSRGVRVRFSGDSRKVIPGPFSETNELVAGYWIWHVQSLEEAIAWAKRAPNPMPGEDSDIEIRQIYEMEDFGTEMSPEVRAQEESLRSQAEDAK